ncbi:MAG: HAMP domain-containing histidine kinase [Candidatus Omnitrophica bacterium]|nr:HAMP domain-containing histidine kinase [Candidatus Omnitrophota bacterium]MBU1869907.1 HAMP domain-containing histidine kinase [Candidatus Omnitrophota bacterium]
MKKLKKGHFNFPVKPLETIFWLAIISVTFYLNLSPQVFKKNNTSYIIIFVSIFLIFILHKIYTLIKLKDKKSLYLSLFSLVIVLPFLMIAANASKVAVNYYFPALVSVSMAMLLILDSRMHVIIIILLCLFFLGEAFFGIYVSTSGGVKMPMTFFRMYSLTLLAIFTYYLYSKENVIRREVDILNERLKEFDTLKSDFLANVSHELRTPLTSIRNAVFLLKSNKDKTGGKVTLADDELMRIIISNVDRQSHLIDEVLDLAKIERGAFQMPRSLVSIKEVVDEVLKSLSIEASEKSIRIIADIDPHLPKIYGSDDQLAEVYTNLLHNAIKYNHENGKVYVHIKLSGNYIESVVRDTGIGISHEDVKKLFDRFKRLEAQDVGQREGVGLGLVIVKEIIELHGGKIWVESKIKEGSKFVFTLPLDLRIMDRGRL